MLIGKPEKAERVLGWKPKIGLKELAQEMIQADIALMKNNPLA